MSVLGIVYEQLAAFDKNQKIVPMLAENWRVDPDSFTYTSIFRKGVKLHDGGEFNLAAFKVNYSRCMKDEELCQYRTVSKWESVEMPNNFTMVIKLKIPNIVFINKVTSFSVVNPEAPEQGTAALVKNLDGTGAYQLKERVEGDHVVVAPFADYWSGRPLVNSVVFKAAPEDGACVTML